MTREGEERRSQRSRRSRRRRVGHCRHHRRHLRQRLSPSISALPRLAPTPEGPGQPRARPDAGRGAECAVTEVSVWGWKMRHEFFLLLRGPSIGTPAFSSLAPIFAYPCVSLHQRPMRSSFALSDGHALPAAKKGRERDKRARAREREEKLSFERVTTIFIFFVFFFLFAAAAVVAFAFDGRRKQSSRHGPSSGPERRRPRQRRLLDQAGPRRGRLADVREGEKAQGERERE